MAKLRAGFIGAGSWATMAHLPAISKRDEVEIVAICRKGDDLLKKLANQYGASVATEDYQDVIKQDLDIIVVSSPSGLHHEHSKAALNAGAHVLCSGICSGDASGYAPVLLSNSRVCDAI